jgi:murein L,D-transpeptidase YafK
MTIDDIQWLHNRRYHLETALYSYKEKLETIDNVSYIEFYEPRLSSSGSDKKYVFNINDGNEDLFAASKAALKDCLEKEISSIESKLKEIDKVLESANALLAQIQEIDI